ncbi:unnamed protein product [Cladocopium goreaui]|uniref:Uncharacterized protein n=1 Tax=Cladocopium goreaui TaxID=2562237 RepID=A0A9P1GDN2_9DINO|nr:unnamed protein product [Cladocopium goreaui]
MQPDGTISEFEPLDYAGTTKIFRAMLMTPWKRFQGDHPLEQLQMTYTLHSMKATLLSFGPQLGTLVSDSDRLLQGHHQDQKQSLNLYGRDSVWGSLRYQQTVTSQIQQGWRPKTAQHRGGQFPLVEPTVILERYKKVAPDYRFEWLPFHHHEEPQELPPAHEVVSEESDTDSSSSDSDTDSKSSEHALSVQEMNPKKQEPIQVDEAVFARHRRVTHAMVIMDDGNDSRPLFMGHLWKASCGNCVMTTKSLEDAMSACGVEPVIASQLVQMGWTVQTFACAAVNLEAFDRLWPEFFPEEEPSLLQKASLRAAFKMCQEMTQPALTNNQAAPASAVSDPMANPGTWAESFPPKLDAAVIDQMKTKFLASYPSELVNHDTMPSTRLLSLVHHQLGKKQWAWIPWKYRLTMAKSEEVASQRQSKIPKLEVASLHHLLVDEPPAIDISNTGFGVNAVRNLLAVHDMAVAMCGGAHLANLKAYSAKFLSFLTQKVDPDSMLRCASITEAQAADRQIWAAIADLMSERGWDMDNCLHEFTHIRHDLPGPSVSAASISAAAVAVSPDIPPKEVTEVEMTQGEQEALATKFASLVTPLVHQTSHDWKWDDIHFIPSKKEPLQPPFGQEDGGGLPSNPDWSMGERSAPDVFGPLRKQWMRRIIDQRLDKDLLQYFSQEVHAHPPFSDAVLAPFKQDLDNFLRASGFLPDWQAN